MSLPPSDGTVGSPTALPLALRIPPVALALRLFPGLLIVGLSVFGNAPAWGAWLFAVVLPIAVVFQLRQGLVVDSKGLAVTIWRTRTIPWADVLGFSRGSGWSGGTIVSTRAGAVRSVAPLSWWGGPPRADQLALLERVRLDVNQSQRPGLI